MCDLCHEERSIDWLRCWCASAFYHQSLSWRTFCKREWAQCWERRDQQWWGSSWMLRRLQSLDERRTSYSGILLEDPRNQHTQRWRRSQGQGCPCMFSCWWPWQGRMMDRIPCSTASPFWSSCYLSNEGLLYRHWNSLRSTLECPSDLEMFSLGLVCDNH